MKKWTQAELDQLEALTGVHPFPVLVKKYQDWAKRNGYPVREKWGIASKIDKNGWSKKTTVDNFKVTDFANQLGVKRNTIRKWIQHKKFPARQFTPRGDYYIRLADFRPWALKNPHVLVRVERDRLLWAMDGDEHLTDRILATPLPLKGRPRPVRHVATGREFPSLTKAAKAFHYACSKRISRAIELGIFEEVS